MKKIVASFDIQVPISFNGLEFKKICRALNEFHYGSETIPLDANDIPLELVKATHNANMTRLVTITVNVYSDGRIKYRKTKV